MNKCYEFCGKEMKQKLLIQVPKDLCRRVMISEKCDVSRNSILNLVQVMKQKKGGDEENVYDQNLLNLAMGTLE